MGSDRFYDGEALVVAQKSAAFLARGLEPRHLRMFKLAAEREAGFLEQVVMPLMKQRNPGATRAGHRTARASCRCSASSCGPRCSASTLHDHLQPTEPCPADRRPRRTPRVQRDPR